MPTSSASGRRFDVPGRSTQTRTTSPSTSRRAASRTLASPPLTSTLPRSSAVTARPREPVRSGAARNLSSRTPASPAPTTHSESFIDFLVLPPLSHFGGVGPLG